MGLVLPRNCFDTRRHRVRDLAFHPPYAASAPEEQPDKTEETIDYVSLEHLRHGEIIYVWIRSMTVEMQSIELNRLKLSQKSPMDVTRKLGLEIEGQERSREARQGSVGGGEEGAWPLAPVLCTPSTSPQLSLQHFLTPVEWYTAWTMS